MKPSIKTITCAILWTAGILTSSTSFAYANNTVQFLDPSAAYQQMTSLNQKNQPLFHANQGYFITATGTYSYMKLPNLEYGNTLLPNNVKPSTQSAFNFKNRISTVMPTLKIGKYFYDNHFLPALFGQTLAISLTGSYLYDKNNTKIPDAGKVFFWAIDGSNDVIWGRGTDLVSKINYDANHRLIHGGVFLSGYQPLRASNNIRFARSARFGFVYFNLDQRYELNGLRAPANAINYPPKNMLLHEETETNYYGIQLGNTLHIILSPQISTFLGGDIAVVYAHTNFNAHQIFVQITHIAPLDKSVANHHSTASYIANIEGGVNFYTSGFPLILTLSGGVNFFGYVPRIINPGSTGPFPKHDTNPAHVKGTAELNPFGSITLTLPF